MARDDDANTRAAAWQMLALLVQPDAQPTRRMLLKACPDVASTALKVGDDILMQKRDLFAGVLEALEDLIVAKNGSAS